MRICMWVADRIEQEVTLWLEQLVTVIQTICRTVVEQVEQWQKQFENQCREVTSKVCSWLPWPLDKVCDWVTTTVCELVEVLVKVVISIVKTICEVVTSVIRIFVRVVLTIVVTILRFACFWLGFVINWLKIIFWAIAGIPEFLLCLLGFKPRKHLHVCVTVLAGRDGTPVVPDAQVTAVMAEAARIIGKLMNVTVHEHGRRTVRVDDDNLDVTGCNAGQLFGSDAVDLTSEAERTGSFGDLLGCGDDVLDIVGEIVHDVLHVIFIRDIREGNDIGCHIPGTDYVIIDRSSDGMVLAHEIGHAGDLWHVDEKGNLMNHMRPDEGESVHAWQVCIFRRSRFVVYAP